MICMQTATKFRSVCHRHHEKPKHPICQPSPGYRWLYQTSQILHQHSGRIAFMAACIRTRSHISKRSAHLVCHLHSAYHRMATFKVCSYICGCVAACTFSSYFIDCCVHKEPHHDSPKPRNMYTMLTSRVTAGFPLLADHLQHQQSPPKRKRSWSRAVFSALQRKGLEKRFEVQRYVTKPDRRQLASMLGLTDAQVLPIATCREMYEFCCFQSNLRPTVTNVCRKTNRLLVVALLQ